MTPEQKKRIKVTHFLTERYAKLCHESGVIVQKLYKTETEARAFVDGFNAAAEIIRQEEGDDPLEDFFAATDSKPARDE